MNEHVVCPHCGYIYSETDEKAMLCTFDYRDDDRFEERCVHCGKPLIVTRRIVAQYDAKEKP